MANYTILQANIWSARLDLNQRPLAPQATWVPNYSKLVSKINWLAQKTP